MSSSKSKTKIAVLILAAGESKRMGKPKQLLKWGHSTLLNHSIGQAVASKADEVYLILGANFEKIRASIVNPSLIVYNNKEWNQGMGNTLAFGIKQLKDFGFDGVLLMLADQPQVDTSFLNILISEFELGEKPIVATSYKTGAGVPALFDKTYFERLLNLSGDKGAKSLISENLADTTFITPKKPVADIDTIEAYQELYQLYF